MLEYNICAPYQYNGVVNEYLSEYKITYDKDKNKFDKLCEFLEYGDVPEKRVNIIYAKGFDEKTHKMLSRFHPNLAVCMTKDDVTHITYMKDNNISCYFDWPITATNIVTFDMFVEMGVSELYIADDLCYMLPDVSKKAHDAGVRLRCVLNRLPSTAPLSGYDHKAVIYRPNDIDLLNEYFDVFEFDCGPSTSDYNWRRLEVLHRAFFKQKEWYGELSEINEDIKFSCYNPTLLTRFFTCKYTCGRRCGVNAKSCERCENYLEMSNVLRNRNMKLLKNKE